MEGVNDFYAIGHLCQIHGVMPRFRLEEAGGYESLRDSVDTYLLETGLQRIGFIVDADDDLDGRWASLRDLLHSERCGYNTVPAAPPAEGVVVAEEGRPVLGLWVMPDNAATGALEEFLRALIPPTDPHWGYAAECVEKLPLTAPVSENWRSKARLHTWLAWRTDGPGKPIGQAIVARDFDHQADAAERFVAWVRRLFALDAAP